MGWFTNLGQEARTAGVVQHAYFFARYSPIGKLSPINACEGEFGADDAGKKLTIGSVDRTLFEPVGYLTSVHSVVHALR
jgi:hypothetical protein